MSADTLGRSEHSRPESSDDVSRETPNAIREGVSRMFDAWDRFWFTPSRPHTVCVLRFLTGAMLLYSHLVLASDLSSFMGDSAWINNDLAKQLHDGSFGTSDLARTYLWNIDSPSMLAAHHGLVILITAMFMMGALTRVTAPLAVFFQLMVLHRLTGALFGLDQIVTYTTMYLALTPCGSCFSVDAWWRRKCEVKAPLSRFGNFMFPDDSPSAMVTVGSRLLQLHLCVIYLFGGLSKGRGDTWWNGTAVWYAISNYEYQSLDMTWMSRFPALISAFSNATLFWEVFYCALVWNRYTRPLILLMAYMVHGSIALMLGMITFGCMMMIANSIFLPPSLFQSKEQKEADRRLKEKEEEEQFRRDMALLDSIHDDDMALLNQKQEKVRSAAKRVKRRYRDLKQREETYETRVKKLREREQKIKVYVDKRREKQDQEDQDSEAADS